MNDDTRKLLQRLLIVVMVLALATAAGIYAWSSGAFSATHGKTAVDTQVVADSLGRQVEVPRDCQRIAALDSFAGEALIMAGAGPLVVTVPNGVSSDVILQEIYPGLADLPSPKSSGAVNIEALGALEPDVVLIRSSLYYSADEVAKLDKLGIPYLVVDYQSVEGQIDALRLLQQLLPAEQAQRMGLIIATYEDAVARVEDRAARIPVDERVR
ncbi:MAG: ABC transporter substrate-binding protein, partial [Coriobacteriales bacterium]|nr:ABC transporter substrate-binding protein [Coriobacteriales bacterium]